VIYPIRAIPLIEGDALMKKILSGLKKISSIIINIITLKDLRKLPQNVVKKEEEK
jgi:hypothetical protein